VGIQQKEPWRITHGDSKYRNCISALVYRRGNDERTWIVNNKEGGGDYSSPDHLSYWYCGAYRITESIKEQSLLLVHLGWLPWLNFWDDALHVKGYRSIKFSS
jgi:hypothetical protein